MLAATEWEPWLLGLAAVITSIGGLITSMITIRRSGKEAKEKADDECRERLRATRVEAEQLAAEIHDYRMGRRPTTALLPPSHPRDERPEEDDRWSHLP